MYCVFMPDYKLKNKIFAHSDECAKKKTIIIKIMKKITLHIICIISFFATACSSNNAEVAGNVKSIVFNSEESVTNSDFNKILDTTFRVIPLATNDECLISNIDRLEIVDGKFYIMDHMSQSVYVFNPDGSYAGKIHKHGRGPGEYTNLSFMTVTYRSIIVIDHFVGKQIFYDRLTLQPVLDDYDLFKRLRCTELFAIGDIIYYMNDWSNSAIGKYRLFSNARDGDGYSKYLPFKKDPGVLGINGPQYGIAGNEALMIYSGDDHIYKFSKDSVCVQYRMEFKDPKAKYTSGRPEKVFEDNRGRNAVLGINRIQQSERYIFAEVTFTGEKDYYFLYDKVDDKMSIYEFATDSNFSDKFFFSVKRVIGNEVIYWINANTFAHGYKNISDRTPKTGFEKELYGLLDKLSENDNPVLFVFDIKQEE